MLPSTASGVGLGPGTDVRDLGTFASAHQPLGAPEWIESRRAR